MPVIIFEVAQLMSLSELVCEKSQDFILTIGRQSVIIIHLPVIVGIEQIIERPRLISRTDPDSHLQIHARIHIDLIVLGLSRTDGILMKRLMITIGEVHIHRATIPPTGLQIGLFQIVNAPPVLTQYLVYREHHQSTNGYHSIWTGMIVLLHGSNRYIPDPLSKRRDIMVSMTTKIF